MIDIRPDYEPTAYDDDWEDLPTEGPIPKWVGGVVVPTGLVVYGLVNIVMRQGSLPGRGEPMPLTGGPAVALGCASVSIGLLLHCHYFWGNIVHLAGLAVLGKVIGLLGMIASLGYLLWHVGVLGK